MSTGAQSGHGVAPMGEERSGHEHHGFVDVHVISSLGSGPQRFGQRARASAAAVSPNGRSSPGQAHSPPLGAVVVAHHKPTYESPARTCAATGSPGEDRHGPRNEDRRIHRVPVSSEGGVPDGWRARARDEACPPWAT
jgi:hypothetical protein